jgi:AcrR family transcriptional regulator
MKKEQIVMHATELFHKDGYQWVSIAKIAASVWLQKTGIFHYFPNKEYLINEVISVYTKKYYDNLQKIISQNDSQKSLNENLLKDACSKKRGEVNICLCAKLLSNFSQLPVSTRHLIKYFFKWCKEHLVNGYMSYGINVDKSKNYAMETLARIHGMLLLLMIDI